jgi:hypothetical protein
VVGPRKKIQVGGKGSAVFFEAVEEELSDLGFVEHSINESVIEPVSKLIANDVSNRVEHLGVTFKDLS